VLKMLARSYLRSMRSVGAARNAAVNTSKVRSISSTSINETIEPGEQGQIAEGLMISLSTDDCICSVPLPRARRPQMLPPLSH
jgi:hypothetical protein